MEDPSFEEEEDTATIILNKEKNVKFTPVSFVTKDGLLENLRQSMSSSSFYEDKINKQRMNNKKLKEKLREMLCPDDKSRSKGLKRHG